MRLMAGWSRSASFSFSIQLCTHFLSCSYTKYLSLLKYFSISNSVTHSVTNVFALLSFKIKILKLYLCNQNISMITFEAFSVCHSLGQLVRGATFLLFLEKCTNNSFSYFRNIKNTILKICIALIVDGNPQHVALA